MQKFKDFKVLIEHLDKYPLLTKKQADYVLFKRVVKLMEGKEHLTLDGLQEVINIKASMNKGGLSDGLKTVFPDTKPVQRPDVELGSISDPNWLTGFTDADGCFRVKTAKSSNYKLGLQVQLSYQLAQHSRDAKLMGSLVDYLDCGNYFSASGYNHGEIVVTKFSDIIGKIIPFFDKYPLLGVKSLDYADFRKVASR